MAQSYAAPPREPVQESDEGHHQGLEEYINVLRRENESLRSENYHCSRLNEELLKERRQKHPDADCDKCKQLHEEIEKLRYQFQVLQHEGKVCSRNCVISVILWICRHKLDEQSFYGCGHQLRSIITYLQAKNITKQELESLKCEYLMDLFEQHEIVIGRPADDYENPSHKDFKEVWKKLTMARLKDEKVCIMGVQNARNEGGGHCVVLDMESKTDDGKVKRCDPQTGEEKDLNEEDFITEVTGCERLRLYTVNWKKLKALIREHSPVLHKTYGVGLSSSL